MSGTRKSRLTFMFLANTLRPVMDLLMAREWSGSEKLPRDTGFIVCPNHVTEIDPVAVGHFLYNQGIMPHFMAKASLFNVPVVGSTLRAARMIPVERMTSGASRTLALAREIVDEGGGIIVYPEGTLTRDPDLWPMKGRTGAARLALLTGAPIVPIAHWGAQDVFPRYAKRLHVWPRKTVRLVVGEPVDISEFRDRPLTAAVLDEVTERIMSALTVMVAELRQEPAPTERWDPRVKKQRLTGRDFEDGKP
ncbi:lysophospholipid acyltransferase family protein [Arthrobacter roseus]|uniref:lysophospholipid acyltransferase family protein n=1 Tax=Arthrobacter roseus TaxID=136274 RepID=UPI001964D52B|nr:lysophospholipid acyltransferase family protein [Arthrobacter roseus]MBM7848903.1 1-acyl-sn-glycerol-3-phosphate acyltransferase [Arthrobacter roseus]